MQDDQEVGLHELGERTAGENGESICVVLRRVFYSAMYRLERPDDF